MSVTLLKKISASDLLGPVVKVAKEMEIGEVKLAFGVAGVCNKLENGVSQYGEWTRFLGDFQAVNYLTGEQFRSEKAHAPNVLEAVLLRDLENMKGAQKELKNSTVTELTGEIEFAFTVSVKRLEDDDKGGVNYEYITTPKTEVKENDRISHLGAMLQLDAPKEETKAVEKAAPKGKAKA